MELSVVRSTVMTHTRKSTGKSRLGCKRCKSSRVKCDEIHPACTRCVKSASECVYMSKKTPDWKKSTHTLVFSKLASENESTVNTAQATYTLQDDGLVKVPPNKIIQPIKLPTHLTYIPLENLAAFNSQEVFLLHHFRLSTSHGLWGPQLLWAEEGVQLGFSNPFLMHAILATAARHLQIDSISTGYPSTNYALLEAQHYQKALSVYSAQLNGTTPQSIAAILAASFLFIYYSSALQDFKPSSPVPSGDSSITFIRGLRAIIHSIGHGEHLGPMALLLPTMTDHQLERVKNGPGKRLLDLVEGVTPASKQYSPTFERNRNLYIERVHSLAPYFSSCTLREFGAPFDAELVFDFLRWQALCPAEFVELIRSYDKVALVIMAHYYAAAVCHLVRVRNAWWWWRGKPKYMVQTILDYLDNDNWVDWKEWPTLMLLKAKEYPDFS